MKESDIEKRVSIYAKKLGFTTYKFTSPSSRGVPDRIYVKSGITFFIEFKAKGGQLSKLQEREIRQIRRQGIDVHVVDNVEMGKAILDNFVNYHSSKNQVYYNLGAQAEYDAEAPAGMSLGQKCAWHAGWLDAKGISFDEYQDIKEVHPFIGDEEEEPERFTAEPQLTRYYQWTSPDPMIEGFKKNSAEKQANIDKLIKEHDKLMEDYDPTAFNFNCSSLFRDLVPGNPKDYKEIKGE